MDMNVPTDVVPQYLDNICAFWDTIQIKDSISIG